MNQKSCFIPILTSEAGSCLTLANWQEIAVTTVSYYLDALLMKPGFDFLNSLPDLRSYCGWQGSIVINASRLRADSDKRYNIRSRFDGSVMSITEGELVSLILNLKPDRAILPSCLTTPLDQSLLKKTQIFIPANDLLGCYCSSSQKMPYLAGEFDLLQLKKLLQRGPFFIESDKPARDAFTGLIYSQQKTMDLVDTKMSEQHIAIDDQCTCPTCEQKFTRAYLHHLFLHTPLLCKRFLIHHNAYYYQQQMQSFEQTS